MLNRFFDKIAPPSSGTRFPALDGLRGIACLLVVLQHAPIITTSPFGRHGSEAVTIFFSLSAFLLFYPWAVGKKPDIKLYYRRRVLRIYPAYLIALGLGAFATWYVGKTFSAPDVWTHLTFTHAMFRKSTISLIPAAWSLPAEIQFYLILPILAIIVASRPIIKLALLFGVLSVVQMQHAADSTPWRNIPVLLNPFLLGMLVAVIVVRFPKIKSEWLLLGLPLAVATRVEYLQEIDLVIQHKFWYMILEPRGLISALAVAALLLGVATSQGVGKAIFAWKPLRLAGICGYGIFIFHNAIFVVFSKWFSPLAALLAGIPVVFLVGLLSYQFVEAPCMRLGGKVSPEILGTPFRLLLQLKQRLSGSRASRSAAGDAD